MITQFKIFENIDIEQYKKYIDNFLISTDQIIYLCNEIRVAHSSMEYIFVNFDCFDFNENNEIQYEAYGDHENLKKEELDKLHFLTPTEFYNKYTELCTNLYEKVKYDFDSFNFTEGDGGWYPKLVKNYKRVLETIPEFEHFASAEKYNL
jgi:hypothetical protein